MTKLSIRHYGLWLCAMIAFSSTSFGQQKYELHPLVGRTAPTKWADHYSLKSVSILGVRGGMFYNDTTQVEGEFEYLPHFEFRGTDPKNRAFVWGISLSRNIFLPKSENVVPYFSFGVGGVTVRTESGQQSVTVLPDRTVTLDNNDTFFALNYGVGIKKLHLSGPVGLRANVVGHTLPNFFSRANSWAEISGGLIFTWGDR